MDSNVVILSFCLILVLNFISLFYIYLFTYFYKGLFSFFPPPPDGVKRDTLRLPVSTNQYFLLTVSQTLRERKKCGDKSAIDYFQHVTKCDNHIYRGFHTF